MKAIERLAAAILHNGKLWYSVARVLVCGATESLSLEEISFQVESFKKRK